MPKRSTTAQNASHNSASLTSPTWSNQFEISSSGPGSKASPAVKEPNPLAHARNMTPYAVVYPHAGTTYSIGLQMERTLITPHQYQNSYRPHPSPTGHGCRSLPMACALSTRPEGRQNYNKNCSNTGTCANYRPRALSLALPLRHLDPHHPPQLAHPPKPHPTRVHHNPSTQNRTAGGGQKWQYGTTGGRRTVCSERTQ